MQITFIGEKTINISEGQSILSASLDAGIPHFHACGGNGKCSTCRVLILEGLENLSAINKKEAFLRSKIPFPQRVRLACQSFIEKGDITIERIIKDELDFSLFLNDDQLEKKNQQLGVEKELVLFFLDIKNFTPFVDSYLPFDVIHVVRRLFFIFHNVINKLKGRIVETAGDGLYAVFGFDSTIKEAADFAIEASKQIVIELDELNEHYLQKYFFISFEVGIGIHLGKVIVGKIRIADKNTESIMGLAVNVASRLQAVTRELDNNILISEELARHSSIRFPTPGRTINLKGINQEVTVHLM
ncbi:MAG TPA: adenylate/guanylate cyclase domain-containing protein, partial [Ferruginibacter sp.]|nr:adenylate/guanylate cyclase domain-containing protein [Ferruginibacter sp.]